jgi:monosaccharide-transporting ATPase
MSKDKIILTAKNISKTFPGVKALDKVEITLREGEVHALMGENGAGNSTLVKVITGVFMPDSGNIQYMGKKISPKSPEEAQRLGISTVYQEVSLCSNLSVAVKIYIGREPM